MPNALLNALNRQLAAFETAGMTDHAKRVKARITVEEKAVAKAERAEAKADDAPAETESSKTTKKETT